MLKLNVQNETSTLKAVVLGTAKNNGIAPTFEEAYDPKSREHILAGTYPKEEDMVEEIEAFVAILEKYDVTVYRPDILEGVNQIFARDIAFVIEDKIIKSNILPDRLKELDAIDYIYKQVPKENRIILEDKVHVEGGDVMPWNDYIFVGTYTGDDYPELITARTNIHAVKALQKLFPHKKVKSFELRKSNTNAKENALHLDCCFQPIGKNKAILHKNGFLIEEEYNWIVSYFGRDNIFEISKDEMYAMTSNVFSISETIIVSEQGFTRLNTWLRNQGFMVEEIPYAEIAKQEGLLRCSTLPLLRSL